MSYRKRQIYIMWFYYQKYCWVLFIFLHSLQSYWDFFSILWHRYLDTWFKEGNYLWGNITYRVVCLTMFLSLVTNKKHSVLIRPYNSWWKTSHLCRLRRSFITLVYCVRALSWIWSMTTLDKTIPLRLLLVARLSQRKVSQQTSFVTVVLCKSSVLKHGAMNRKIK